MCVGVFLIKNRFSCRGIQVVPPFLQIIVTPRMTSSLLLLKRFFMPFIASHIQDKVVCNQISLTIDNSSPPVSTVSNFNILYTVHILIPWTGRSIFRAMGLVAVGHVEIVINLQHIHACSFQLVPNLQLNIGLVGLRLFAID